MTHTETQPPPLPNDGPDLWLAVIGEMHARRQTGISRYGTPLQPHNGRDALRDAMDEALDLVVYLKQAITERDQTPPGLDGLQAGLANTGQAILGLINQTFAQGKIDTVTGRALHDSVFRFVTQAVQAASTAYSAGVRARPAPRIRIEVPGEVARLTAELCQSQPTEVAADLGVKLALMLDDWMTEDAAAGTEGAGQ